MRPPLVALAVWVVLLAGLQWGPRDSGAIWMPTPGCTYWLEGAELLARCG